MNRRPRAILGALSICLIAGPAPVAAMTPESCDEMQRELAAALPVVGDLRLAADVTADGWCRIISEPLAGLEWQAGGTSRGIVADFRRDRTEFPGLGEFGFTGQVTVLRHELRIGPMSLRRPNGDFATLTATTGAPERDARGLGPMELAGAELRISGSQGLIGDVLAWAFRLDARRARSNFAASGEQRETMRDWLDALPPGFVDETSRIAFEDLVRAYPSVRGTAVVAVPGDRPVALGPLISALLFGTDFSNADAAALVREAGLQFRLEPD